MATKKKLLEAAAGAAAGGGLDIDNLSFSGEIPMADIGQNIDTPQDSYLKSDGLSFWVVCKIETPNSQDNALIPVVQEFTLSSAFDLTTVTLDQSSYFDLSAQISDPKGLFFKSDGTEMYILDAATSYIYSYDLSTAWDVTTASANNNVDWSGRITVGDGHGLFFRDNGASFYVCMGAVTVHQFNMSTSWDISTSTHHTNPTTSSTTTDLSGLAFKSDGTKLYLSDEDQRIIYRWDISTAWDLTTMATYHDSGQDVDIVKQSSRPVGLNVKSDGTEIFFVGRSYRNLTKMDFAPGTWSLASASVPYPTSDYFDIDSDTTEKDVYAPAFKPDGTMMFFPSNADKKIFAWNLSTAWEIDTATLDGSVDVSLESGNPYAVAFSSDGTKMLVGDGIDRAIYSYNLSTAWDVTTKSAVVTTFTTDNFAMFPYALFWNDDGTKLYVSDAYGGTTALTLTTGYDLSTASAPTLPTFRTNAQDTLPEEISWKSDGTSFYITGRQNDGTYQYNLSTAWDVSTATYDSFFDTSAEELNVNGMDFKTDGTSFYVVGQSNDTVYQYNMSTAWDISTASYSSKSVSVNAQETIPQAVSFKSDGTSFYVVGSGSETVYQYDMTTAWDVSTASYANKSVDVSDVVAQGYPPNGLAFKSDGTKMYVLSTDDVSEWNLSTAWDVSTATVSQNVFTGGRAISGFGLAFKSDGTKMYVVDNIDDFVVEFDLSTAWDVTTTTFASTSSDAFTIQLSGATNDWISDSAPSFNTGGSFSSNGEQFFIIGYSTLYSYKLTTAYDFSTMTYDKSRKINVGAYALGATVSGDETYYYVGNNMSGIYAYTF